MAEQDTAGQAEAPAGQGETTAAGAASTTSGPADPFKAYEERIAKLEKGVSFAQNAVNYANKLKGELSEAKRQLAQRQTQGYDFSEERTTEAQQADKSTVDRLSQEMAEVRFRLQNPNHATEWPKMVEIAQNDPDFAAKYGHLDDTNAVLDAALMRVRLQQQAEELATLRAVKAKMDENKEAAAGQAFLSGQTASAQEEVITKKELDGMSAADMEKKFGKEALLRGLY